MRGVLGFIGGLAGAISLSQFPEFSQQYLQRLGGQRDALAAVVQAFDASATENGLTREAALADLSSSPFQLAHQADIRSTIERLHRVEADLTLLRAAGPLERLALPHRFRDTETFQATWNDFKPAVPVTPEGLMAGGIGLAAGWLLISLLLGLILRPFRRHA